MIVGFVPMPMESLFWFWWGCGASGWKRPILLRVRVFYDGDEFPPWVPNSAPNLYRSHLPHRIYSDPYYLRSNADQPSLR